MQDSCFSKCMNFQITFRFAAIRPCQQFYIFDFEALWLDTFGLEVWRIEVLTMNTRGDCKTKQKEYASTKHMVKHIPRLAFEGAGGAFWQFDGVFGAGFFGLLFEG